VIITEIVGNTFTCAALASLVFKNFQINKNKKNNKKETGLVMWYFGHLLSPQGQCCSGRELQALANTQSR
jgi:hypothetical protein